MRKGKPDNLGCLFILVLAIPLLTFLYVLGIGPATWLLSYGYISNDNFEAVYQPLVSIVNQSPQTIRNIVVWYVSLWNWVPDRS